MTPKTRPLGDNFPVVDIDTQQGGSTSTRIGDVDASKGKTIINFIKGNKDLLLGILLGLVIIQGVMLFFEYRRKAVASDLATYNYQEARIQQEINGRMLAILTCKEKI